MTVEDKDLGMKAILQELKEAEQYHVKVGILGKQAGEAKEYFGADGTREKSVIATLAEVASAHEFGSPSQAIPERSFLRSAVDANRASLVAKSASLYGLVADGKLTAKNALGLIGQEIEACIDDQFEAGGDPRWPPVKHREGTPLNDTGQLKNSITSVVAKGK